MSLLSQLRDYELRKSYEEKQQSDNVAMPFMYTLQNVRWELRLNGDGTLRDVLPLSSGRSRGQDTGKPMAAPNVVRTVGIKPRLLMDNAEYVLGQPKKAGDKKALERHQAFVELVQRCAEETGEGTVQVIANFLVQELPKYSLEEFREEKLPDDFTPDANTIFTVDGINPLDLSSVQKFWASQFSQDADDSAEFRAECLITGEVGPVMKREPVKVKGILGGQTSGMSFISANAKAFASYGLEASHVAPVKFEVAEQYASGLNRLLADSATCMKVAKATFVFWAKEGATLPVGKILNDSEFDLAAYGLAPEPSYQQAESRQVGAVLSSPFAGRLADFDPQQAFYLASMTPSGSRIAVRSHLTTTLHEVLDNLKRYFAAQALAQSSTKDRTSYDLYALVSGMYRDARKEHTEPDVNALVQFALTGQPLPLSFLPKLNARNRVDEYRVTRPRAVLTKMVLLSRDFKELTMDKDTLDALNPNQPDPAYHLGRLLAVLDSIQRSVMKANTTLVDRFYGSMSTMPHTVVGRLIHGAQAHLQKLRKENGPAYSAKQSELAEVMSHIADIPPKPLSTAQQALFALGYYHQRAHTFAVIEQRSAAKKARESQNSLLTSEGEN